MTDAILFNDRADVAKLIAATRESMPWRVPIVQAAHDGILSYTDIPRGAPLPAEGLRIMGDPSLVLVGDDDYEDTGPKGWTCAKKLSGWARFAVIHAARGEAQHYRCIVQQAVRCRRLALIETSSKYADAWERLFSRAGVPTFAFLPKAGLIQPAPRREAQP